MAISKVIQKKLTSALHKYRRILMSMLVTGIALFIIGCSDSISISGTSVSLNTERLDLNGSGLMSFSSIKKLTALKNLDLRNNDLSKQQFDDLQKALPNCTILWSVPVNGRRFDSNSTSINDPDISIESAPLLKYFRDLKIVDASGTKDFDALKELVKLYPQYQFRWNITFDNQEWPHTERTITISSDQLNEEMLEQALVGFMDLEEVNLSGESISSDQLERLQQKFPQIDFIVGINIADRIFDSNAISIDLSNDDAVNLETLVKVLPEFSNLKEVNLMGSNLLDNDKEKLLSDYPDIQFHWPIEILPGIIVDSLQDSLILSNNRVSDLESLIDKLRLLPALKSVEMCNCGLSDEQMQQLRDLYPQIKFIWLIRVGNWELRTDVKAFSLANVKDFPGGKLVGDEYLRYHSFTAESLYSLKYCTDLIALDIGHAGNVKDLSNLAPLTKLQFLIVAMTRDTDIEVIRNMPDLVFLEIFSMPITDLSPLLSCKKLEYLNCGNCKIKSIAELEQMKQLKRLWIINSSLKDDQLAQLRTALPDTLVGTRGSHPTDNGWRRNNPRYLEMRKLFSLG